MSSIDDELAAIEASTRGGRPTAGSSKPAAASSGPVQAPSSRPKRGGGGKGAPRKRGSSNFMPEGSVGGTGRKGYDDDDAEGLLVDFPGSDDESSGDDRVRPTTMKPGMAKGPSKGPSKRGSGGMVVPPKGMTAASLTAGAYGGAPPPTRPGGGGGGGDVRAPPPMKPGSGSSKPASYKPGSSNSKPVSYKPGSSSSSSKPASYKPGGGGGSKPLGKFDLPEIPPFKPTPLPEIPPFKPAKPAGGRLSEAERMRQRQKQMEKEASTKSGTKDHRPLVGGFAAAAYEAARADHFASAGKPKQTTDRPRDLPSI